MSWLSSLFLSTNILLSITRKETLVEGTPINDPKTTNEDNPEAEAENMEDTLSLDGQIGENTSTPMANLTYESNQTLGIDNMEETPSVNENTEDATPQSTNEPSANTPSFEAPRSTLISLEPCQDSIEKTTIGATPTPIINTTNLTSTVVQAFSTPNITNLSIWDEIAAFQRSIEHTSPLPQRLHDFSPEDQQVVTSFLDLLNTPLEEYSQIKPRTP